MEGADVFIGLSRGGLVNAEMVAAMADNPIVFALAMSGRAGRAIISSLIRTPNRHLAQFYLFLFPVAL